MGWEMGVAWRVLSILPELLGRTPFSDHQDPGYWMRDMDSSLKWTGAQCIGGYLPLKQTYKLQDTLIRVYALLYDIQCQFCRFTVYVAYYTIYSVHYDHGLHCTTHTDKNGRALLIHHTRYIVYAGIQYIYSVSYDVQYTPYKVRICRTYNNPTYTMRRTFNQQIVLFCMN